MNDTLILAGDVPMTQQSFTRRSTALSLHSRPSFSFQATMISGCARRKTALTHQERPWMC